MSNTITNLYILKWSSPFASYQILDHPASPISTDDIYVVGSSSDGSVMCGYVIDNTANITYAVRWNGTACTVIGSNAQTIAISQDGNTILGSQWSGGATPYVWIGGATSPTTLPAPGGYSNQTAACMSDDGSIVYGYANNGTSDIGVKWTNTVPSTFALGSGNQTVTSCSNDGSIALAYLDGGGPSSSWGGYYRSGSFFHLAILPSGGTPNAVYGCSGDGSIIYGQAPDQFGIARIVYWDNVLTNTGTVSGTPVYGDCHVLSTPANAWGLYRGNANDAAVVAVGTLESEIASFAAKWTSSGYVNLTPVPLPNGGGAGDGFACSHDGSIIAGRGSALVSGQYLSGLPCYWDGTFTQHILPLPTGASGYASVVTRDGATIAARVEWFTTTIGAWIFRSGTSTASGGFGQAWFDSSYVNFANPTTRAGFITSSGGWVDFGTNGEMPTGSSPLNFLNVEDGTPDGILFGWGQSGGQSSWNNDTSGVDPSTGTTYGALEFDICSATNTVQLTLTDLSVSVTLSVSSTNEVTLRWSDDAGASWSNGLLRSLGRPGEYLTTPTWYRLGMSRNRIIELSWSGDAASALQGAFVEVTIAQT